MNKIIEPNQVYTPAEASDLINISHPLLLKEIDSGQLKARKIGKGWKILGSNLLHYVGTPTIPYPINEAEHEIPDVDARLEMGND